VTSLISSVSISKKQPRVGESVRVQVKTSDPAVNVMINGIYGASQYLQFAEIGRFTIVISALDGHDEDQVAETIKVRQLPDAATAFPLVWATQDRYKPRVVAFTVPNASADFPGARLFSWQFGDGTSGSSRRGSISHDYTPALARDELYTSFDVQLDVTLADGSVSTGRRTISLFNTYALNKIGYGILTPLVSVLNPSLLPQLFFVPADVLCTFAVTNLEDEDIVFTRERHEWLTTETTGNESRPVRSAAAPIQIRQNVEVALAEVLRIPSRSTVTVQRIIPQSAFSGSVFGIAIHLGGEGACSHMPAIASAYIEVKLPMQWSGLVTESDIVGFLSQFSASMAGRQVVTHQDLSDFIAHAEVNAILHPPSPPSAIQAGTVGPSSTSKPAARAGVMSAARSYGLIDLSGAATDDLIKSIMSPRITPFDDPLPPQPGAECDPDNLPDNLPEGMVCQLTSEVQWRYVPGRILNAKKGDLLLDPGGPGLIGQLLRQVTPPQFYSHCGIMTMNHIELRHSTGSDDWLKDHPAGDFLGNKGTRGFDPQALKYLWPGTVTQTIDNAYSGQWMDSPDTGPYRIADFSFAPDLSNSSTIIYPLVVKPSPFDETAAVRLTLHQIADAAVQINGHYRFYCYTDPAIALTPEGTAGPEGGWANGTVATVCSSFIWLAAQHAGVKLEGPNAITSVNDLEIQDIENGAQVDGSTPDGLYLYTAQNRQAAGNWLYQTVYNIAYNKAGFWGTLFTDAPDNVANQLCNTFASDWADDGSPDSDAWKSTGSANAVSPDNMQFWDSPGPGNQGQFRSVYGFREELFFQPGTYAQVPIYRWKLVPTRGTVTGTVTANADVFGANVSLLGSGLPDVVVHSDGRFEFDKVPAGDYTISAGLNINNYWNSATAPVHVDPGQTTVVDLPLQPPLEINRFITISVDMETDWSSAFAHSPHYYSHTASAHVHPFQSHAHLDFGGGDTPRGQIGFDIDLNADLSVNIAWTAQEIDDEVEGTVNGGTNVRKNDTINWQDLTVVNDDPIDNDATTMNFSMTNGQDSA
jgi:hypothetical protein